MNHIIEELGIPKKYLSVTTREDTFTANVHRIWIKNLLKQSKLTEFIEKPNSDACTDCYKDLGQSWLKIFIKVFKKRESKVLPLPRIRNKQSNRPLLFPLFLQYISQTNYKNLWKEAYKKYCNSNDNVKDVQVILADYNEVLREIIIRTYGCSIINVCDVNNSIQSSETYNAHINIYPAVCAVETLHAIFLLHIPHLEHNLNDCVTFSPSILEKSYTKPLFIIYQLLQLLNSLHSLHITLGDINLNDIHITEDLWLFVFPQLTSNIYLQDVPKIDIKTSLSNYDCRNMGHKYDSMLKCQICGYRTYDKVQISKNDNLEKLCELWIHGQISNFTYITALNRFSGRKFGDPNCHHVFPWVTDFSSRCGKTWRNLNKSKYRLNKGDRQLDLTYEDVQSHQIPHHVSDVLSAITYYVYVARRTAKATLCKYVRSTWVPGEYPISIQRLQEWTPDECIPEFFTDPTVFKTIHDDMDDLEVPSWCSGPEEFVEWHRDILESNHVSERLHYWIDLTFGYKLSGNAAIKSKNVCLHLVDEHTNLTSSGIVQLFKYPHPSKIMHSPYYNKSPPQIFVRKHRERDQSVSYVAVETSKSEDDELGLELDVNSVVACRSPLTLSRFLSRSRSSLNEEREQKPSRSPSSQRSISLGPKNPSFTSHIPNKTNDVITLPKDYNPTQALTNLENRHNFYMKTFHKLNNICNVSKATTSESLRVHEDVELQYDDTVQNSFTNRIFTENFEGKLHSRATKSYTFPMDQNNIPLRSRTKSKSDNNQIICNYSEIIASRKIKELQVLGCLIVEIFMNEYVRTLGNYTLNLSFNQRLQFCIMILNSCKSEIPPCIKYLAHLLLQPDQVLSENFEYPAVTDIGLPPPSAHLLLEPLLHSIIPFPTTFMHLYQLIANLKDFDNTSNELNLLYYFECNGQRCLEYEALEKTKISLAQNVAECKIKLCVKHLECLMDVLNPNTDVEIVNLLVPHVKKLLEDVPTSVLTAWYLFDPISKLLGPQKSCENLLDSMLKLYENDFNESNLPYLNKIAKLYHHSFHLRLIVRFGLKCFLEHFITPLVEAVGGYRDYEKMDFFLHTHSEKIVRKTSNLKNIADETNDYSPDDSSSSEKNSLPSKRPEMFTTEPEVFDFESEEVEPLESLIEHLELNINHDVAYNLPEEAIEVTTNDLMEELNLDASDEQDYKPPLMSPTIPIPNKKNKDLVQISCEVGSKSSDVDALDKKEEFITSVKLNRYDAKISDMSAESLNWLSHRLGPVLTAKFISRNLLKMLTLCYVGKENLTPTQQNFEINGVVIELINSFVVGDKNAAKVLECLTNIAALYGEQFILLQYIPHIKELITLCKRRLSPNLEGSLISCLSLLKHIIPYISDATLVLQLEDILKFIIHPCVRLLGSTKFTFPNGIYARRALAKKYLDTLYMLSLRMGAEMSRTHLAVPALQRFFLIFEKIGECGYYKTSAVNDDKLAKSLDESHYIEVKPDGSTSEWVIGGKPLQIAHVRLKETESADSLSPTPPQEFFMKDDTITNQAFAELKTVFTSELAHTAYLPFLKQMGQNALQISLKNHDTVLKLSQEFEQEMRLIDSKFSPHFKIDTENSNSATATRSSIGSNIALIGNRIDVQEEIDDRKVNVANLISDKMENTSRHLRGNWLAYWEHEIGRSDKDTRFNFKQIKLQTFNGHTHSIKALHVLDNENSFISGSRDKTVKLWSLRSQGDGSSISSCQWTYTEHKKSILALTFIESLRLVASCDSIIRIWDPFMMRDIKSMESIKHAPVNVLKTMPSPSALLYAATTEGTIKVIDARTFSYIHELKVNFNQTCLIRCLAISNSGHWVAAGQSSGYITVLDTRTGLVKSTWRAHESEVLQLVAYGENNVISSSLDQTISVWNVHDGHFLYHMKGASEPVHCLNLYNSELISGTTANRIGVHTAVHLEASFYSIKLRHDAFKGILTSMTILPLNRLLLLGADSGNISLLC